MSFTDKQISALNQPINKDKTSWRWANRDKTFKLYYLESWHVIREANRVFDYDWTSETIQLDLVNADKFCVTYIAKVRVTVGTLVKEGIGAGHGRGENVPIGDKHESAAKEAESDARKRALMQFGDQFGLSLYDKEKNWQKTTPPVNNDLNLNTTSTQKKEQPLKSDVIPESIPRAERMALLDEITKYATSKDERELKIFNDLENYCRRNFPIDDEGKFSDYIQEKRHAVIIKDVLRPYRK